MLDFMFDDDALSVWGCLAIFAVWVTALSLAIVVCLLVLRGLPA
jgi:hypothetical protein